MAQDDHIEGICVDSEAKSSMILPRIDEALELNLTDFVTHDSCQQVVREVFYGDNRSMRSLFRAKSWCGLKPVIMSPIYAILYVLTKWRKRGGNKKADHDDGLTSRWGRKIRVPVNQLIVSTLSYFFFVLLVFLTQMNPWDVRKRIDIDVYDTGAVIWAVGYIAFDIENMMRLSRTVRLGKSTSKARRFFTRLRRFFSDGSYNFRLLSDSTFVLGVLIEAFGYFYEKHVDETRQPHDQNCDYDDPTSYGRAHPVKVGIGLQGVGVALIVLTTMHLFRLDASIGSVYIALRGCVGTIFSFLFLYANVSVAFGFGLHFTLKWSAEECGEPFLCNSLQNETLVVERLGRDFGSLGDKRNRFVTLPSTFKTLFWSLFDPGQPDVVGCSQGFVRYSALVLWGLYNIIVVIILLNLLVALLSVLMSTIQERKLDTWKYHRTHLWIKYCSKTVVLPSPLNLLDYFICFIACILRKFGSCFRACVECCRNREPPANLVTVNSTDE